MIPSILRRSSCSLKSIQNGKLLFCTASPSSLTSEVDKYYRTKENNPLNHDDKHLGRLYTIPQEEFNFLGNVIDDKYSIKFSTPQVLDRNDILQEQTFMVRRPYVETLQYLKQIKWPEQDNVRFILWGKFGSGKSVSLSQISHFALKSNFILLNFRDLRKLLSHYREATESEFKEGRWDFPVEAQTYLKEIKHYNFDKLDGLVTHKAYKWSEMESTPIGSPLSQIIETGLNRPRFSADCLNVFLKELKTNIQQGWNKYPVMLMLDGVNVLFQERTLVSKTLPRRKASSPTTPFYIKEACTPDELSLLVTLKHMLKQDFKNSCVMASVDRVLRVKLERRPRGKSIRKYWNYHMFNGLGFTGGRTVTPGMDPDYPFVLLGNHGWQHMHPFIPIETTNYTPGEMDVMIDYYTDKSFIRKVSASDDGRKEIHFLTGRNPWEFHHLSNMF